MLIILILALLHGLAYVFLLPVWQHYDEPNHFEYVWLAAHLGSLPQVGDYDPEVSRSVVKSMLAHGFYDWMDFKPELSSGDEQIKISGYTQLEEPPLYYLLASIPLRGMGAFDIEKQLYMARMVSLMLFLLTVLIGWGVARELSLPGHALRWMLPATLALLPGFAELMTAVNNDVMAVFMFSLFFLGSVRLIRRKFSLLNLVWAVAAALLTYFSKNTAMLALLLLPVVILFALVRGSWRPLAWGVFFGGLIAALFIGLSWDDALFWYRATSQIAPVRIHVDKQALGDYALELETQAQVVPDWSPPLFQPLPPEVVSELQGKRVVLGAWMWASQQALVDTPILKTPYDAFSQPVVVDEKPRFYAFEVDVPENIDRLWVYLQPKFSGGAADWVYYDGLVLVAGEWPLLEEPHFSTSQGVQGEWGGHSFVNLIRNGSVETPGPRVTPWIDNLATRYLPDQARPSMILTSLVDVRGAGQLYSLSFQQILETFWAKFGWGHVRVIWDNLYTIFTVLTFAGIVGAVIGALRRGRRLPWDVAAFVGLTLLFSWGMTLTRGSVYLALPGFYLPTARHSYPVIIPFILILVAGWLEVTYGLRSAWRFFARRWSVLSGSESIGLRAGKNTQFTIFLGFFLLLDLVSLVSIARYYNMIG